MIKYIVLLSLLLSVSFAKVIYISNYGNDQIYCGTSDSSPCRTIEYGLLKVMHYVNSNVNERDIQVILDSGVYQINKPINLYSFNVTISPNGMGQVTLDKTYDNYYPMFYISIENVYWNYGAQATKLIVNSLTVTGCNVESYYAQGSFVQINDLNYTVPITVELNNVEFACSTIAASMVSYSGSYGPQIPQYNSYESLSSSSSTYYDEKKQNKVKEYDSSSYNYYQSSSSSSSNGDGEDSSSYNYYQSSSNNGDGSSSSSNNQNLYTTFVDNQIFGNWPTQGIQSYVTFTFKNIIFTQAITSISDPVLLNVFDSTNSIQFNLINSYFGNIQCQSFINVDSGSVYFNNVTFNDVYGSNGNFLTFTFSRLTFNDVSIQGNSYGESILQCTDCVIIANKFDLGLGYSYQNIITLTDSVATIENSNHSINSNGYSSSSVYSLTKSTLTLFSNFINIIDSSMFTASKSTLFINRNNLNLESTSSSYDSQLQICSSNVDINTKVFGDSQLVNYFNNVCYGPGSFVVNQVETLYLLLAFFVGVFVIVIFFIIVYSISAICKCRRRNKKLQYKEINN